MIHAIATDNLGAISVATVEITVNNCINNTFSAMDVPIDILDFPNTTTPSSLLVTGNGTVGSLSL